MTLEDRWMKKEKKSMIVDVRISLIVIKLSDKLEIVKRFS